MVVYFRGDIVAARIHMQSDSHHTTLNHTQCFVDGTLDVVHHTLAI